MTIEPLIIHNDCIDYSRPTSIEFDRSGTGNLIVRSWTNEPDSTVHMVIYPEEEAKLREWLSQ